MDENVRSEEREIDELVANLADWLSKQPHLPNIEDKNWLCKFLINSKFRPQKAKFKLENYYSARSNLPAIFQNRDPTSLEVRQASEAVALFPLPRPTKDDYICLLLRFDPDPNKFIPMNFLKRLFMTLDVLFCERDSRLCYMIIMDYSGFSVQHFLKLATMAGLAADILQNMIPSHFKGVHYVNVPPTVSRMTEFFRSLVKPKLRSRLIVHNDLQLFYAAVDRECLPKDMGGNCKTIAELNDEWQQTLESYKDWFKREESIRSDETLRPPKNESFWLKETEGSFRKLAVD